MTVVKLQKRIQAPIEKVFEYSTDLAKAPERIQAITKLEILTPGPVGKGTRFRETRRVFKREASEEMVIKEFEPPRRYVVGCESHGCRYTTEFRFSEVPQGTDVEMTFQATPLTFGAKMMSTLMRPMLNKLLQECGRDLDDIKRCLER